MLRTPLLAALACVAGCTINENVRAPVETPPTYSYSYTTTTGAPVARTTTVALDDAQIVAVLIASDGSDIAQANYAFQQSRDERVRTLARQLTEDHRRSDFTERELARQLGLAPAGSSLSHELDVDREQTLRTFGPLTGAAFSRSYVDAQVSGHRKMVDLIDGQLLPQAKLPQVAALLRQTRAKALEHVYLAESVRGEI